MHTHSLHRLLCMHTPSKYAHFKSSISHYYNIPFITGIPTEHIANSIRVLSLAELPPNPTQRLVTLWVIQKPAQHKHITKSTYRAMRALQILFLIHFVLNLLTRYGRGSPMAWPQSIAKRVKRHF